MNENTFLCHVSSVISTVLWSERELGKKEKLLLDLSEEISQRVLDTLPPGTVLTA
jgi:hypothetical protein